ncbi:MAG: Rrf2 family transcriptional regulator [Coriobacteriaceae bacterium]|nr:Rrf2 family transcriptional regulator [Coriobacteriaceae bacterium]
MLISTKGRYALRAVVDLAEHMSEGYIPLKDIASRQDISSKYLEAIIKTLVKEKIVVGMRGKGGGYKLNVPPADITVARVLRLAEGSLSPVEGLDEDHSSLTRMSQYRMLDMWRELDKLIEGYLESKTVADLTLAADGADYYVI